MRKQYSFPLLALAALLSCQKSNTQTAKPGGFSKTPQQISIIGTTLPEASGIADSKANPGTLWVEEDSGNPPTLFSLGHDGKRGKDIPIKNAVNRDWEDMVLGKGPEDGVDYLYIGDIGDNNLSSAAYSFYRFREPLLSADTIADYNRIRFVYPDGPHDSEAFLVDPGSKDIFILTKNDDHSKIYKLTYPQDTSAVNTASLVASLAFNGVVSAGLSPDAKELIVKTYTTLYYYPRSASETIEATLARTPSTLAYRLEAQGEAICFSADNSGFYTLSEMRESLPVTLNFYKRN